MDFAKKTYYLFKNKLDLHYALYELPKSEREPFIAWASLVHELDKYREKRNANTENYTGFFGSFTGIHKDIKISAVDKMLVLLKEEKIQDLQDRYSFFTPDERNALSKGDLNKIILKYYDDENIFSKEFIDDLHTPHRRH